MSRLQHSVDTPKETPSIAFEPPQYYQPQHPLFQHAEPGPAFFLSEKLYAYIEGKKEVTRIKKKKLPLDLNKVSVNILNELEAKTFNIYNNKVMPDKNHHKKLREDFKKICNSFNPPINTENKENAEGIENLEDFKNFVMSQIQQRCYKSKKPRDISYWVQFAWHYEYIPLTANFLKPKKSEGLDAEILKLLFEAYDKINQNINYKQKRNNTPLEFKNGKKLLHIEEEWWWGARKGSSDPKTDRLSRVEERSVYIAKNKIAILEEIKAALIKFKKTQYNVRKNNN